MGLSVTQRIKEIKQPLGGYVNPKLFKVIEVKDESLTLGKAAENVNAGLVGTAVDYLTRTLLFNEPLEAFKISLMGASLIGEEVKAFKKAVSIKGLSAKSITAACQLAGYDVCYRAGPAFYKSNLEILPDDNTVRNIEVMVKRALKFFKEYGPVVEEGFTFEGGYTDTVSTGDGDFITADTLWDFKVSVSEPKKEHTLQLLMYYLMGMCSIHKNLHKIKRLGIFNPRLNKVYLLNVSDIPPEIIKTVEKNVIGY
ncbi:MAG: hypothetical protein LBC03_04325 [Nitrososphaerota archaeon]|nr:hypothetical protein [Nitrososphaerota archaeon]